MEQELKACRNCGGKCDPTGWMRGDGLQGPECEGCGITAPDVESWNRLMGGQDASQGGEAASAAEINRLKDALEVARTDELNAAVWAETEKLRHDLWDAQAELEKFRAISPSTIDVVGMRISTDGFGSYIADSAMGIGVAAPGEVREPLMTVAQHQRILAACAHPAGQVAEPGAELVAAPSISEHSALRAACVDAELHSAFESHVMSMSESRRPSDFRIGMDGEYVNSWMRANFAMFCAGRDATTKDSLAVAPAEACADMVVLLR